MTVHDTREIKKAELIKKLAYLIREFENYLERTEDPIRRLSNGVTSFHSFIHSTNLYLLSSYYVPVTILNAGDIVVNKVGKNSALVMLVSRWGEGEGMGGMIINK